MGVKLKQRLNAMPGKRGSQELQVIAATLEADMIALRATVAALVVDITALRTTVAALVVDNANRLANHNTLIAKLNLDAGVTDENYAVATAATSAAPAALTTSAPAALGIAL
jgi:hypothetical protein